MNTIVGAYKNLVVLLLAISLVGCSGADPGLIHQVAAPACVAGDCLALQPGTWGWVISTAFKDTSYYVLALRNVANPSQIVTFAKVAEGFGMAGIDTATQKATPQGTWLRAGDLTAILRSALSKGNWEIIPREEVSRVVTTGGGGAVLLEWIAALAIPAELVAGGVFMLPADILDDTLEGLGFVPIPGIDG